MALDLIEGAKEFEIPHRPDKDLLIRAGINSGSCVAGKLKAADEGTDGAVLIPWDVEDSLEGRRRKFTYLYRSLNTLYFFLWLFFKILISLFFVLHFIVIF